MACTKIPETDVTLTNYFALVRVVQTTLTLATARRLHSGLKYQGVSRHGSTCFLLQLFSLLLLLPPCRLYDEVEPARILDVRPTAGGAREFLVAFDDGRDDEWVSERDVGAQVRVCGC